MKHPIRLGVTAVLVSLLSSIDTNGAGASTAESTMAVSNHGGTSDPGVLRSIAGGPRAQPSGRADTASGQVSTTFVLFVDRSVSTVDQRAHFRRAAVNALGELGFGDRVFLFRLDGRTRDRGPAFHASIPFGGGLSGDTGARAARAKAKAGALAAIDRFFEEPASPHSDVFGVIELIPRSAECECRIVVYILSDGLNDLPPLNVEEKARISEPGPAADLVMRGLQLEPGLLAGIEIRFVTEDVVDEKEETVPLRARKRFFEELLQIRLHARLTQFGPNEMLF